MVLFCCFMAMTRPRKQPMKSDLQCIGSKRSAQWKEVWSVVLRYERRFRMDSPSLFWSHTLVTGRVCHPRQGEGTKSMLADDALCLLSVGVCLPSAAERHSSASKLTRSGRNVLGQKRLSHSLPLTVTRDRYGIRPLPTVSHTNTGAVYGWPFHNLIASAQTNAEKCAVGTQTTGVYWTASAIRTAASMDLDDRDNNCHLPHPFPPLLPSFLSFCFLQLLLVPVLFLQHGRIPGLDLRERSKSRYLSHEIRIENSLVVVRFAAVVR
ncbi:hypothetical protein QBC37DRAFT_396836 [Rhypophila decipiens]|uniref:Uncharacterized protein n=1 Tax=Rhypophila decipiens TaxID=261697 RepID=A0AAN6YGS9_9PEZI|nr:hypothetical protein QBC37DRAFT_396836 [Rhypophila decipiens]